MSNECWSYGPESDWCGEHDSELSVPDPNDPELWVCQFVAHGFGHHEDLEMAEENGTYP